MLFEIHAVVKAMSPGHGMGTIPHSTGKDGGSAPDPCTCTDPQ